MTDLTGRARLLLGYKMQNKVDTTIIENKPVFRNFCPAEIKPKHYVMGVSTLPKNILMANGHGWKAYRPVGETQYKNGIDPASCPAGGTLNAIEHLGLAQYKKFGFQSDLAERHLSILMGMVGNGGWPWDAAEKVREYGAIPEVFLPFDKTITSLEKYFSPQPMNYSLFKIGLHWTSVYDFGFEWVINPTMNLTPTQKKNRMKEALQYSILGVAGYAWSLHSDGKYYNDGPDIHFFNIDDYSEGNYWDAFDTYDPYGKVLDWDYNPNYAIRYSLIRKMGTENITFTPDDAPEAKFEYIKYWIRFSLKKLIGK